MLPNPDIFYNSEVSYRDSWLLDAERSEALTIPNLRVRGIVGAAGKQTGIRNRNAKGSKGNLKPFTNVGRDGLNTLANTLLSLLFSLDIRWFRLETEEQTRKALIEGRVFEDEAQIDEAMRELEDRMFTRMSDMALRSKLHALFRRNLVEGNNILHLWKDEKGRTGLRIVPLRNFICKRRNGELQRAVIQDQVVSPEGETRELFTEIDYDEGKVYQFEKGSRRKTPQENKDRASYFMVVTPSTPEVEDYADGYVYELLGDLELHNSLTYSVDRAMAISAKSVLVNDSSLSGISTFDLQELEPGEAIEGAVSNGAASGIGFISAQVSNSNIAPVIAWMERIEDRLTRQFAGLLSAMTDQFAQPRSATEISRIASELDTFAAGIGQVYNANLQRPLAQAFLDLVIEEEGGDPRVAAIKPRIVAGTSQLSRLQELSKYLQAISTQLQMNPQFALEINWRKVWDRMTNSLGIDTDGTLKTEEEKQEEANRQADTNQLQQIRDQQLASLRQNQIAENTTQF